MPRGTNKSLHLRAQAALARSARSSSQNSRDPVDDGASSIPSANSTPPMSPMPSEPSDDFHDIDNDGFEEIPAREEGQASETHKGPEDTEEDAEEDEDGYRTWDDMSELEGDELKDSLERQKAVETEQGEEAFESAFKLLMEGNTAEKWGNAESNRHLGYGSKNSGRTQRRKQKNKREAEEKNEKSRNSSVNQWKNVIKPNTHLHYIGHRPYS